MLKQRRIGLSRKRTLLAAYSFSTSTSSHWIVFLQESGAIFQPGHRRELELLVGRRLAKRFNYLIVNKPGLGPKGQQPEKFEASFRRSLRVADALVTIKKIIPDHHSIILVGYSEGAYLAPEVALGDPRVRAVIMIGGGTRGWLKEEINNARSSERRHVLRKIAEIKRTPRSLKKWNGFFYATWYSYRKDQTLTALRALSVPTLAILGKRDRTIDFKATIQDLKKLKKNGHPVHTELFKHCGHSFKGHWGSVRRSLRTFIQRDIRLFE